MLVCKQKLWVVFNSKTEKALEENVYRLNVLSITLHGLIFTLSQMYWYLHLLIFEKLQNYKFAKITNFVFCFSFRHRFCMLFFSIS